MASEEEKEEEEEEEEEEEYIRFESIVKPWMGWLGSFTLSMMGAGMLTWWALKYHPANEQQWMVPLGLILFLTPIIVSLAAFISEHSSNSTCS